MDGGRQSFLTNIQTTPTRSGSPDIWKTLKLRIESQEVIPIISNALFNNLVFDINLDGKLGSTISEADKFAVDDQLATDWAKFIGYPLAEWHPQFSRIAQYNLVKNHNDDKMAKTQYLSFLKMCLLGLAYSDTALNDDKKEWVEDRLAQIQNRDISTIALTLKDHSFAEMVSILGYPRFGSGNENPLELLARLPLPVYITTSHHDFMERALANADKKPRVQVCPWNGMSDYATSHWFDPNTAPTDIDVTADPTPETPLVYHLYGLDKNPASLVISEDDYMEFLIKVSVNEKTIPLTLRRRMTQSSLLLLGYRLSSWDFRALFKGVIKPLRVLLPPQQEGKGAFNFAVQLDPSIRQTEDAGQSQEEILKEAREYIQSAYFESSQFEVQWKDSTKFVQELMQKWEE